MFKKVLCGLIVLVLCLNVFTVAAARTGEFETQFVEFQAFVPDDLAAPVHIELTDKNSDTVLNYYLYENNQYFNNVGVALGVYDVKVRVENARESDFNFIYDKVLNVKKDTVAMPFRIIVDDASLVGDAGGNKDNLPQKDTTSTVGKDDVDEKVDDTPSVVDDDKDTTTTVGEVEKNDSDDSSKGSSLGKVIVSLVFSILIIAAGVVVYWFVKKRNY